MTSNDRKQIISEMKKVAKEVKSSSSKAKKLLVDLGICTSKGNLKRAYK
jgi:hypothetical protein